MLTLLIYLIIFGFVLWLVTLIPMDPTVKKVVIGVAILLLVLFLLQSFGLFSMPAVRAPSLR